MTLEERLEAIRERVPCDWCVEEHRARHPGPHPMTPGHLTVLGLLALLVAGVAALVHVARQ